MGLGILEDAHLKHVPGTATLEELDGRHTITDDHVKRTKDGIILVPQPSDDPEDPLNWPLWQRDLATFLLCMLSVMASTLSPLMAANTLTMIQWYGGISPTDAALLTGWHLFGVGISGFIFVAMARVWGKRHLFILAPLIIIASCAWAGCSGHNYKSLVAARFFQGVGLAPFEGLVNAAVGEIYFVHESGKRLALTNLCLFGGAFFTPVIVGITTLRIGWQWTFWLVSIFTAALLPFVYVYCPETSFVRHTHTADSNENLVPAHASEVKPWEGRARPISSASGKSNKTEFMDSFEQVEIAERTSSYNVTTSNIHEPVQRKLVTRRSLRIFSGRKTQEPFWKLCLRPFALFLYPSVLWAVLVQGALICWVSIMGVSLAIVMIGLQFNEAETGYMYGGAFVGALGAFVLAGLISDPTARFMTRRNGGVFEPEFRMVLVLPWQRSASRGCSASALSAPISRSTAGCRWMSCSVSSSEA